MVMARNDLDNKHLDLLLYDDFDLVYDTLVRIS